MMASDKNITQLFQSADISAGLRNIADVVDRGGRVSGGCTVIINQEIFHLGCVDDDQVIREAIFNMTLGINMCTQAALDGDEEG